MKIIHSPTEKELLTKLRDGDTVAFNRIYELYAQRLAAKLIHLLRSEELAEDILQDLFIKIWEIRETINPELSFGALLYKMASNLSKNVYRRNLYDQVMRDNVNADIFYNPIEDTVNHSEAKELLESALNTLTPRQREIYILHKLEGRSYQEISDLLQISGSAINHHIQQANKRLKTTLKPHYFYLFILVLRFF